MLVAPDPTERRWRISHKVPRLTDAIVGPPCNYQEVVPASLLEERDRTIKDLSWSFHDEHQRRLTVSEEGEVLRSQLSEARAALENIHASLANVIVGDMRGKDGVLVETAYRYADKALDSHERPIAPAASPGVPEGQGPETEGQQ